MYDLITRISNQLSDYDFEVLPVQKAKKPDF